MQAAHSRPNNNQQAYTILRIKRKRTDEPLDALVVESRSRRKKSRGGGLDVFQFAQTLEADAWDDERARQDLQTQITKLAQDRHVSGTKQGSPIRETRHPGPSRTVEESNRRYTIRMAEEDARVSTCRRPTSPPKVISTKDVPQNDFKMYDAVLTGSAPSGPTLDPEMEKFLPMLQDYLTLNNVSSKAEKDMATGSDYVWDIFYRRPYSLGEWQSFATNVGTVTGFPLLSDDEFSSPDESEDEDEADEDSNAEEYYKNDYPDEASDSDEFRDSNGSDMFHEHSDADDISRCEDFGDDGDYL